MKTQRNGASQSPLARMTAQFPQTALWNDSADQHELRQAITWGAVGATCNPVIALTVMKADESLWQNRIRAIASEHPTWTESAIGWRAIETLSVESAKLLEPAFHASGGRNGRLSIQVDPRLYRDSTAMAAQALEFHQLAPNLIVKIPALPAGLEAMEEVTRHGVSVNATISFSVAQAMAVGEAIERGLQAREKDGLPTHTMGPVCTIMGGRLDDWLKFQAHAHRLILPPGCLDWAGVATVKRAYHLYQAKGWRTRLLAAAFRSQLLLTELVGGELVISPPFDWQALINENDAELPSRINVQVNKDIVEQLRAVPDFERAYEPEAMGVDEFAQFGATKRTLRQFLAATADIETFVREAILPAPSG